MEGTLILDPRNPADWKVPRIGEHGFAINFADREFKPDEAWLGSFVRFEIQLPLDDLDPKEELTITFRNPAGGVGFTTGDPSGANALIRMKADPAHGQWQVSAFRPAVLRRAVRGTAPDTVTARFLKSTKAAGAAVKPRRVLPRLIAARRDLEGKLWVEYAVPAPGGTVRVLVFDQAKRQVFRHESQITTPGVYGVEWPESRHDPPPPPGKYFVVVEIAGHRMEAECEL